jgi:hypothetical protein
MTKAMLLAYSVQHLHIRHYCNEEKNVLAELRQALLRCRASGMRTVLVSRVWRERARA